MRDGKRKADIVDVAYGRSRIQQDQSDAEPAGPGCSQAICSILGTRCKSEKTKLDKHGAIVDKY